MAPAARFLIVSASSLAETNPARSKSIWMLEIVRWDAAEDFRRGGDIVVRALVHASGDWRIGSHQRRYGLLPRLLRRKGLCLPAACSRVPPDAGQRHFGYSGPGIGVEIEYCAVHVPRANWASGLPHDFVVDAAALGAGGADAEAKHAVFQFRGNFGDAVPRGVEREDGGRNALTVFAQ